ncbi:MAG: bifunctional oligoribonuclease/PAP phosphatase NrnA [Calditrichaceae bacterium]
MSAKKLPSKYPEKIYEFIVSHNNFLLSAHMNADGDAIASVVAVSLLLDSLKKDYIMVFHDQKVDIKYQYLKNSDRIMRYSEDVDFGKYLPSGKIESAIILDVPSYKRLGDVSALLPDKSNIIKIDHHPVEDVMGEIDWIDESASSTTAMFYEVLDISKTDIDIELAKAIFTGIVYDTGRFSFSNTSSRDLYICSRMVEKGAKPDEITDRLFFQNSIAALKTIGKGLNSLETHLDGLVSVVYLSNEDLTGNNQSEIEELANYSAAIKGSKIGLFIREAQPGFHKVSFRSKCDIDVNLVAKALNGGGHARAAGARLHGTKDEIIDKILQEIKKQLK